MVTTLDDTGIRFLIALISAPMIGWALGYFIRKSINLMAFIGGMFFFVIGTLYYRRNMDSLSVLQKGEDILETAVNRTIEISIVLPNIRNLSPTICEVMKVNLP
jgi:uncharacterized membrane protein (Fun14 family)